MGQQTYIKTKHCEEIYKLGNITQNRFNEFISDALAEKIEREKQS